MCHTTFSVMRTKISVQNNFKTQNNFSSISNQNTFQFHFNINIQNYISKFFSIHFKIRIKMSENIELSYVWDHTIIKISIMISNLKWETMGRIQQNGRFRSCGNLHFQPLWPIVGAMLI